MSVICSICGKELTDGGYFVIGQAGLPIDFCNSEICVAKILEKAQQDNSQEA